MKCPKCGYISFDHLETCKQCQAKLEAVRESLGLAETVAAAGALEAETLGPVVPQAPPSEPAGPAQEAGGEARPEGPAEEIAGAEPGLELDPSALEGAELEGPQATEASDSEAAAEADEMPEAAPELEAAIEALVLGDALGESPDEAGKEPVAAAEPEGGAKEAPSVEVPDEFSDLIAAAEQAVDEEEAASPEADEQGELPGELSELVAAAEQAVDDDEAAGPEEGERLELPDELSEPAAAAEQATEEEEAPGPEEGERLELPDELPEPAAAAEQATEEQEATGSEEGERLGLAGELDAQTGDEERAGNGEDAALGDELELDEEVMKFLEQEGASIEELASEDDDEPPAAAGGGGDGTEEIQLVPDEEGDEAGGSRSACEGAEPERAPFWLRALALSVDASLILTLILAVLATSAAAFGWAAGRLGTTADPIRLLRLILIMAPLGVPLITSVLGLAYFTCFHGLAGSTPGKMLLGLEVRRLDGGRLGCGLALLRSVGYLLSALPLALGFLWAVGADRLAWHDLMTDSEVLRA